MGTGCFVALYEGRDVGDPLLPQLKEAGPSVLAEFLQPGPYENQAQRVVEGQRMMQTASDIFLGWTSFRREEGIERDCYWRQLKDMKLSAPIEEYRPLRMVGYARLCGPTLAHLHAPSRDAAAIAGYIGSGDVFVDALVTFANADTGQNERDFHEFVRSVESGDLVRDEGLAITGKPMMIDPLHPAWRGNGARS